MQLITERSPTLIKSDSKGELQMHELQGSAPDHASSQQSEIPERLACVTASYSHTSIERNI
jgi:hypothetical protein